jgi:CRISPR/Cas system-associated endonuclease Cas1
LTGLASHQFRLSHKKTIVPLGTSENSSAIYCRDEFVIYLVNKGVVKLSHFTPKEKKGVRMNDAARKTFLANHERFMTASFVDVKSRKRKNYRQIIKERVFDIERILLNNTDYTPYVFYS